MLQFWDDLRCTLDMKLPVPSTLCLRFYIHGNNWSTVTIACGKWLEQRKRCIVRAQQYHQMLTTKIYIQTHGHQDTVTSWRLTGGPNRLCQPTQATMRPWVVATGVQTGVLLGIFLHLGSKLFAAEETQTQWFSSFKWLAERKCSMK